MKLDGGLVGHKPTDIANAAQRQEAAGYDGVWTAEINHDPFFPLLLASEATESVELGTGIAVGFARSPMVLAQTAWDLQMYSGGRHILGLGSQIKPHITKRFSMPWGKPAARMKESIEAIRAIWDTWQNGTPLAFEGQFYTHKLMTPMFTPEPLESAMPKIFLAAVGPMMTRVAAEVADGIIAHAFTTPEYLKEVTLPMIEEGLAASGRSRADFEVSGPFFTCTGLTEEDMEASKAATRKQLAFYGSTPAYKGVLDHHGLGELQPELNALSKQGEWDKMATLIDDDILNIFAVVAEPADLGAEIESRFGGAVDRLTFSGGHKLGDEQWQSLKSHIALI
jgi:probable F420-dependent oxidoreductase